jgi:hypothetical protein
MSDSIAIVSSICSEVTSSDGRTALSSSIGDIAALLGDLDHLLDGVVGEIEQRAVGAAFALGLDLFLFLGCHIFILQATGASIAHGARALSRAATAVHPSRVTALGLRSVHFGI